ESELLRGVRVAVLGEIQSCGDDTSCVHAERNHFELPEAAQEQAGSGEQNQRNGNLNGDQYLAKPSTRRRVDLFSSEQFRLRTAQCERPTPARGWSRARGAGLQRWYTQQAAPPERRREGPTRRRGNLVSAGLGENARGMTPRDETAGGRN